MTNTVKNTQAHNGRVHFVIGPTGETLTKRDLPPSNTKRWVVRRKAEVVAAVRGGLLTLEEACTRYTLSVEEFLSWQTAVERDGLRGLRVTQSANYRTSESPSALESKPADLL